MKRYLLDTNILSDAVKPQPAPALLAWLGAQRDDELYISSLTLAEIRRGILDKPTGRKRNELETWYSGPEGPAALFAGRILPFDATAALHWAALMAQGRAEGRPRNALDMIVAATAQAHGCVVVSANERDFAGLDVFNPQRGQWLQDAG